MKENFVKKCFVLSFAYSPLSAFFFVDKLKYTHEYNYYKFILHGLNQKSSGICNAKKFILLTSVDNVGNIGIVTRIKVRKPKKALASRIGEG